MSVRNGRPAERLDVLRNVSKDLWVRLEDVRNSLMSTSIEVPWTQKSFAKARDAMRKKFPAYPSLSELDNSQGPQELQSSSRKICEQLEDWYLTIYDFVEWKDDSWKLMTELADDFDCPEYITDEFD